MYWIIYHLNFKVNILKSSKCNFLLLLKCPNDPLSSHSDIKVAISTFGRFKTRFVGVHTPPTLHLHLPSFVFYSVDEFGEPLKEKWPKVDGKITVYKQIALIVKVELAKRLVTGLETLTLLADTPCEVNLSMVKKVSTAQLLSLNCELSMENVEVLLASSNIMKYLIEFYYGIGFCMIKVWY